MKFLVELWLDGYDSEEEMQKACEVFIKEQLDFSGSSVKITKVIEQNGTFYTETANNTVP